MLNSFFNKGFRASNCKTLLKLTIPRIKLLRNRREIQLKQMRKNIANLLENGQEATARIRVEHIIREENMMAAQEIIELFCELITVRLPIIEIQRECPLDLKEAISSICFAAPRCSDLPELQQVQISFATKYGKEFVAATTELMPDCGVNRQLIELLSVHAPSVETKLKLLKEIAEEHEVDWDPAATEDEFLKPHEDLLNGPNYMSSSPTLPLPKEKQFITSSSKNTEEEIEEHDLDSVLDSWNLPQVPKASDSTPPFHSQLQQEEYIHSNPPENKQFIPFVSPPSPPLKQTVSSSPPSQTKPEAQEDLQDVLAAAQAAADSAERAAAAARAAASLAQVRITKLSTRKKTEASNDIDKDVVNEGENPTWNQHNLLDSPNIERRSSPHPIELYPDYHKVVHEPSSIEDDTDFSYPNLFSRQDSNLLSSENSSPAHHT